MDVSIYSGSFPTPFTSYTDIPQSRHVQVGYSYLGFVQALKQVSSKIVSITIWGTSDDKSWLTSSAKVDAPLLFDPSLQKKPAYWAFVDPLQLPGADLSTAITAAPTTVPAGQAIVYTITVTNNADINQQPFDPTRRRSAGRQRVALDGRPGAHGVPGAHRSGGVVVQHAARGRERAGAVHARFAAGRRHGDVHA